MVCALQWCVGKGAGWQSSGFREVYDGLGLQVRALESERLPCRISL